MLVSTNCGNINVPSIQLSVGEVITTILKGFCVVFVVEVVANQESFQRPVQVAVVCNCGRTRVMDIIEIIAFMSVVER